MTVDVGHRRIRSNQCLSREPEAIESVVVELDGKTLYVSPDLRIIEE
jgi:hypothetical protein